MKKLLLLVLLACATTMVFAQSAYIQVTGEAGLSVYLNNQYKGKTSAEFNGYVIENVSAGKNTIKIVKDGFTPYEETLTIKPGEVFAYKVKPFTKHIVNISEQGNTGQTEKKASIETGKLIIQSVPIEIKITIPDIEGISNTAKTKDEWIADKIPAGNYTITFTYNQKTVTKNIEISGNETTSVFVNMFSGDVKTKSSLDEKKAKQGVEDRKHAMVSRFVDSVTKEYKFKARMKESDFRNYNTVAATIMTAKNKKPGLRNKDEYTYFDFKAGSNEPSYAGFDENDELESYSYNIIDEKKKVDEVLEQYTKIKATIERLVPAEFRWNIGSTMLVKYPRMNTEIHYSFYVGSIGKTNTLKILFMTIDRN